MCVEGYVVLPAETTSKDVVALQRRGLRLCTSLNYIKQSSLTHYIIHSICCRAVNPSVLKFRLELSFLLFMFPPLLCLHHPSSSPSLLARLFFPPSQPRTSFSSPSCLMRQLQGQRSSCVLSSVWGLRCASQRENPLAISPIPSLYCPLSPLSTPFSGHRLRADKVREACERARR